METPQVINPRVQGEPVLVAFALACPASVAADVAAEEAPPDAEEPAEDEDVAAPEDEGVADDVLPELGDAEEPEEAEEPSLA